jgi:hypothetical protein
MGMQMLRAGLEAADARDDEVDGSLLRWTLCHFLLLRGKTSGFTVQDFLDLVEKVSLHGVSCKSEGSRPDLSLLAAVANHDVLLLPQRGGNDSHACMHACMQAKKCRRIVKSWASADEGIMDNSCKQEHYIYKALGVYERLRAKVSAACSSRE